MNGLYPLKFNPIYLEKIWGGNRIKRILNKDYKDIPNCGESWEISAVEGKISTVANGYLAGNNLQELVEIYMGELVGDKIYEKFGIEFPLLLKFIDTEADLSIQVHPTDELSKKRHGAFGKTEMWYVIAGEKGALINSGFKRDVDLKRYLEYLEKGKLTELLHYDEVESGDVFFMPAGRVHAIGKGVLLAEIQQTSDVTYRIYDYNRKDAEGKLRELHTDLAIDAIDFTNIDQYKSKYEIVRNDSSELVSCNYFTTNFLVFDKEVVKNYHNLDSFIIYMTIEGSFEIEYEGGSEILNKGETILIPANIEQFVLNPFSKETKVLEVYIK